MSKLTMEEALKIQRQHLNNWKELLKPEIYSEVEKQVLSYNTYSHHLDNPYYVFRGDDITNLVMNIKN